MSTKICRDLCRNNPLFIFPAGLSPDGFELLCKDGSRRPISEYLACNWGKVPSDAVVTSSAVSFEAREFLQRFLKKIVERYPKLSGNSTFGTSQTDFNKFETRYDQFGNKIQPENDQFRNRNRYKRQNFGNLGSQENRNTYSDVNYGNPYRQNNSNYNPYGTDNQNNPNRQYDSNNRDNQYNNQRDRYTDPYRTSDGNEQSNDAFGRDPYVINPDQYGKNIDPYETDVKYRKPTDYLYETSTEEPLNQNNSTFYEVFSLFESVPRYGRHGNLLFQVKKITKK